MYNSKRHTVVCIDLSVAMHQLEESLFMQPIGNLVDLVEKSGIYKDRRAAEIAAYKQLTKLNMDWLMSLDWLGVAKPDSYQVVMLRDWKVNFRLRKGSYVEPDGAGWNLADNEGELTQHNLWGYWRHEYLKRLSVAKVLDEAKAVKKTRTRKPKLDAEGNVIQPKTVSKSSGVAYKGGRAHASDNFMVIKDKTQAISEATGWNSLGYPGYEADDIAGAIVKLNNELEEPNQILMVTTDTDWLGLVDEANTFWFCMFGHYPRLRDTPDILAEWSLRRLKVACSRGSEIYDVKAEKGDTSDNLPGGCPEIIRGVVDLLNPLDEYDLLNQFDAKQQLRGVLKVNPETNKPNGVAISDILDKVGMKPFIRRYDANRDYPNPFTVKVPDDLF